MTDEVIEAEVGSSDADLIAAVRAGDHAVYGTLYARHEGAAHRLARHLTSHGDADDLVSDAFLRVLAQLQAGKGPDVAFRAYLLTAVRRLHADRARAVARTRPTDQDHELDSGVAFDDTVSSAFENEAAARAFRSLPERWQLVLWHLEVEGQKPADVAPLLGMSANSVSALAYRAREGLRQAYLASHAAEVVDEACQVTTGLLGGFVRGSLSARDSAKVDRHLDGCRRCTGVHLELLEVNQGLRALLAPVVLGPAAAGYVGAGAAGLATAAAGAGAGTLAMGGASVMSSTVVAQVARVAVLPAQAAVGTVASAGAPAVVATVVAGTLTTGVVVGGADLLPTDDPVPVPTSTPSTPAGPATPDPSAPASPTPSPSEPESATPTPSASPSDLPTPPGTDLPPTPETSPSAPGPAEEPTPEPPPVTPTDFGLGTPTITNDSTLLQRRVLVPVTADGGSNPVARTVTVTVVFDQQVRFRGIPGGGWGCDAERDERVSRLSCSTTLPAGQGGTFPFKAIGTRPAGTVTISAPDDPSRGNDNAGFRAKGWLLPL